MDKRILLLVFNISGYAKQIIAELEKIGYTVTLINYFSEKYSKVRKIKNPFLRNTIRKGAVTNYE